MNPLQEKRTQLAAELTAIAEKRSLYIERYTAMRAGRVRREEIEREIRLASKPMEAHRLVTMKLDMVREELGQPAEQAPASPDAQQERLIKYQSTRREILGQEESRLVVELGELKTTVDRIVLLSQELGKLEMDDRNLEYLVENIQRDYNEKAEELRRLTAQIELEGRA